MDFNKYLELTLNNLSGVFKSKLLYDFSLRTFKDFPNLIHSSVRENWDKALAYTLKEREAFISGAQIEPRNENIIDGDRLLIPYFFLQKAVGKDGNKNIIIADGEPILAASINFKDQILHQNLVYFIGILESYIYDSVKIIYQNSDDELSKHDLHLSFSDIINSGNQEDLKQTMINKALGRNWSEGGFSKRIEVLRNKFNINIGIKKKLLRLLDEANLLRNCILHNGGKVSNDYFLEFGKEKNITENKAIIISPHFLDAIYYLSIDFIKILSIKVSEICWDNKSTELYLSGIGPAGYFKDVMTKSDNWIYKELHKNGVL